MEETLVFIRLSACSLTQIVAAHFGLPPPGPGEGGAMIDVVDESMSAYIDWSLDMEASARG